MLEHSSIKARPAPGGTVFELTEQAEGTWTEAIIHDFLGGDDGFEVLEPVTLDSGGDIYGATPLGGAAGGYGTLFKLSFNTDTGWTEQILHSFSNGIDGGYATGVAVGAGGRLYGTTSLVGVSGYGTTYEFSPF